MPLIPQPPKRYRTILAPPAVGEGVVNRVNSVIVADDEDVEWEWTNSPDGTRFVSGYTIVPRPIPRDR
jgi:hypothetical protein